MVLLWRSLRDLSEEPRDSPDPSGVLTGIGGFKVSGQPCIYEQSLFPKLAMEISCITPDKACYRHRDWRGRRCLYILLLSSMPWPALFSLDSPVHNSYRLLQPGFFLLHNRTLLRIPREAHRTRSRKSSTSRTFSCSVALIVSLPSAIVASPQDALNTFVRYDLRRMQTRGRSAHGMMSMVLLPCPPPTITLPRRSQAMG